MTLGYDADQLAGDVSHVLLRQLSLLAKARRTAERRLELRRAELRTPHLRRLSLRGIAGTELTEASELTLTAPTAAAWPNAAFGAGFAAFPRSAARWAGSAAPPRSRLADLAAAAPGRKPHSRFPPNGV